MSKNIIIFYLSEPNTKMDSNSGIVFIMSKKFSGFELHSNGQKYTSIQKLKYTFSIGGIVLPLTHQFRLKFSILFPLYSFRLLVRHKSHLQIDQVCLFFKSSINSKNGKCTLPCALQFRPLCHPSMSLF